MTNKKIILFGAGVMGKYALNYLGYRSVYCFADNYKAGGFYCGKNVISFDEMAKIAASFDIVVSCAYLAFPEISRQFLENGIKDFVFFGNLLSPDDFDSDPAIRQFQDKHKGERCFVIGNGPSLKPEDLTRISSLGIPSFACNMIHHIYPNTAWRPDYYAASDREMFLEGPYVDALTQHQCIRFFPLPEITGLSQENIKKLPETKTFFFQYIVQAFNHDQSPGFSSNPSRAVCAGRTITYIMLQLAAYMGFSEIYLLGVDHDYSGATYFYNEDGHPVPGFDNIYRDWTTISYQTAEDYSREHGFRIYNATRGGKLEVFERVDFDSVFTPV